MSVLRPRPSNHCLQCSLQFNGERIGIAIQANRFSRCLLEESIKYASKRETFGTLLRDHPVIRNKLAHMARQIEATHGWMENLIYQSTAYSQEEMTMRYVFVVWRD